MATAEPVTIAISELHEPTGTDAYPRINVDPIHVSRLADALRSGAGLPPIIVDAESYEIVDGVHRTRAVRIVGGNDALIAAELVHYADDDARWLDAIERNSRHGLRLSTVDAIRVARIGAERGIIRPVIARALSMPEERVRKLEFRVTRVAETPPRKIELKRSVAHLAGREVTAEQATGIRSAPGTPYRLLIRQLTDALRLGLIDETDSELMDELRTLGEQIARVVQVAAGD